MRSIRWIPLFFLAAQVAVAQPSVDFSDRAEAARMVSTASDVFGVKLSNVKSGSHSTFVALNGDDGVVFTHRTDSRTYLVFDGRALKEGPFAGDDKQLLARARKLLAGAGVPDKEIVSARVLQEMLQTGVIDPQTRKVHSTEAKPGRRHALLTRSIDGVPVFSSRELLTLNRAGGIEDLELHWPEIPATVVTEAHRLQYVVGAGWKPPEQRDARVESVEVGIIHSPAAAFVMDIAPVIRVIYAPISEKVGVKSQLFFDRSGELVAPPRQFGKLDEPRNKPRPASK